LCACTFFFAFFNQKWLIKSHNFFTNIRKITRGWNYICLILEAGLRIQELKGWSEGKEGSKVPVLNARGSLSIVW
jgi:hypothetical protein